jgi:hypothetical protein
MVLAEHSFERRYFGKDFKTDILLTSIPVSLLISFWRIFPFHLYIIHLYFFHFLNNTTLNNFNKVFFYNFKNVFKPIILKHFLEKLQLLKLYMKTNSNLQFLRVNTHNALFCRGLVYSCFFFVSCRV